jgi:small-conductance mechanosensitive channel
VFGFWIAASTVGVNFWNIALSLGVVALVMTYAFGMALKNAGAFFLIALFDKVEEGWYVEGPGTQFSGHIRAIHVLWTELSSEPGVITFVPTYLLLDSIIRRNMKIEQHSPLPTWGQKKQ